jgi:hypothetical protein
MSPWNTKPCQAHTRILPPWGQNAPVAELDEEDASGRKFRLRCRADLSHVAHWIQCLGGLGP